MCYVKYANCMIGFDIYILHWLVFRYNLVQFTRNLQQNPQSEWYCKSPYCIQKHSKKPIEDANQ